MAMQEENSYTPIRIRKAPIPKPGNRPMPRSGRILYVDDEGALRDLMTWVLTRAGFMVEVAENGQVGLDFFLQASFDLVLIDLNMPAMNGWTLAQEIKSRAPHVPVGAVTAYNPSGAEQLVEGGVLDFVILKPFRVEEVQRKVWEYMSLLH